MTPTFDMLLRIIALVCFLLASGRATTRDNLIALGLAAWVLSEII